MTEPRPLVVVTISAGLTLLPYVGGVAQTVYDAIMQRRQLRAEAAIQEITEVVGLERFLDRVREDEGLEALLAQALEALTRSSFGAKRKLLARAVAQAFENDEAVNDAVMMVDVLARLEPVHIRALVRLERAVQERAVQKAEQSGDEGFSFSGVKEASDAEPVPVLATLIQTGVGIPATMIFGGAVEVCDVSPFGHKLLLELRNVADEDFERLVD